MLVTLEVIVNQNTFHVHHHHVKTVEHADNQIHIHMNANVHQVSDNKSILSHNIFTSSTPTKYNVLLFRQNR